MKTTNTSQAIRNFYLHPLETVKTKDRITQVALLILWGITIIPASILLTLAHLCRSRSVTHAATLPSTAAAAAIASHSLPKPPTPPPSRSPSPSPLSATSPDVSASALSAPLSAPLSDPRGSIGFAYNDKVPIEFNLGNYLALTMLQFGFSYTKKITVDHFITLIPSELRPESRMEALQTKLNTAFKQWIAKADSAGPAIPSTIDVSAGMLFLMRLSTYQVGPEAKEKALTYFIQVLEHTENARDLEELISEAAKNRYVFSDLQTSVPDLQYLIQILGELQNDEFLEDDGAMVKMREACSIWQDNQNCYTTLLYRKIGQMFKAPPLPTATTSEACLHFLNGLKIVGRCYFTESDKEQIHRYFAAVLRNEGRTDILTELTAAAAQYNVFSELRLCMGAVTDLIQILNIIKQCPKEINHDTLNDFVTNIIQVKSVFEEIARVRSNVFIEALREKVKDAFDTYAIKANVARGRYSFHLLDLTSFKKSYDEMARLLGLPEYEIENDTDNDHIIACAARAAAL